MWKEHFFHFIVKYALGPSREHQPLGLHTAGSHRNILLLFIGLVCSARIIFEQFIENHRLFLLSYLVRVCRVRHAPRTASITSELERRTKNTTTTCAPGVNTEVVSTAASASIAMCIDRPPMFQLKVSAHYKTCRGQTRVSGPPAIRPESRPLCRRLDFQVSGHYKVWS